MCEFLECASTPGEQICNKIITSLSQGELDINYCRGQTIDGAGNMAGKTSGCAARLRRIVPTAIYHHCSRHDLNLALSKCLKVKEVQLMLDTSKHIGMLFKYSPKNCRKWEQCIEEYNRSATVKVEKSKFKLFCETRWVEKHNILEKFS